MREIREIRGMRKQGSRETGEIIIILTVDC
jgi:hypothetical protein